ncbi:hypothetical protein [Pseudomonas cichorii]|uniref:hypothetical protein n=1 Tax=Pseudomonas cichorii TaxID=36746 RepID=UPI0021AAF3DD|nr:hypothetical protein [Pseudomonas cichorii]
MAAGKRTLWGDVKFIVLAVIFLLIAVPGSFAAYRLFWTDATLCLAEGKVLSDEEHRQRFLESLVRLKVDNSYIYKRHDGNTHLKAGIIYEGWRYDFMRTLQASRANTKSFEENFGVKIVAPVRNEARFEYPQEPFVLVTYFYGGQGSATFIASRDVKLVNDPSGLLEKISMYDRLLGFGSKFYEITESGLNTECCGSKKHGETEDQYRSRKNFAYQTTMNSISRGFTTRTAVTAASGCGDVLTDKNENGFDMRHMRWVTFRDR